MKSIIKDSQLVQVNSVIAPIMANNDFKCTLLLCLHQQDLKLGHFRALFKSVYHDVVKPEVIDCWNSIINGSRSMIYLNTRYLNWVAWNP